MEKTQEQMDEEKKAQEEAEKAKGTRTEERIKSLIGDKTKAEEEATKAKEEAKAAKLELEFERAAGKFPALKEFRSEIEEKVKSGMSVEDATTVVLHAKGKLGEAKAPPPKGAGSGGSAGTVLPEGTGQDRDASKMSREELREELLKEQAKGNLFVT